MIETFLSKDVWLVVLGAFLALIASVVMVFVQNTAKERRTRRLLQTLLRHEIEAVNESIHHLIQQANFIGFIPLLRIAAIKNVRQGYDRNRDWLILFEDDLRRDLYQFYLQLQLTLNDAESLENFGRIS